MTTTWNGWVEAATVLDVLYRPLADALLDTIPPGGARRILDVGCGTGATTIAATRHGHCVGVDISDPMVTAARKRAGPGPSSFSRTRRPIRSRKPGSTP